MTLERIHRLADFIIARLLKRKKVSPPCCSGCFHCCREAVYCTDAEVRLMLLHVKSEDVSRITFALHQWGTRFKALPFKDSKEPPALEYRAAWLWCPFLIDGKCSVYEHRPLACRMHVAIESARGCVEDKLRAQQKFALFPALGEVLGLKHIKTLRPGESITYDHLGVLLYKEVYGEDRPTKSRIRFSVQGDDLIVEKYA